MSINCRISRRDMLRDSSTGFGALALAGLLADDARSASGGPLAPRQPH